MPEPFDRFAVPERLVDHDRAVRGTGIVGRMSYSRGSQVDATAVPWRPSWR